MASQEPKLTSAGALAAGLLVGACGSRDDLHTRTVRDLAGDLGRVLTSLSEADAPDSLVEAALACADLATLAACNVSAFPEGDRPAAVAATHLAAGTARALVALVEAEVGGSEETHAENVSRDVRSAGWKVDLAVRQIGEAG